MKFHSPPVTRLVENLGDIHRLLDVHRQLAGEAAGYKHDMEVLHKSAIVLLVACWEAYVEDLASRAFDALLEHAPKPTVFPRRVLTRASKSLRDHDDETMVWKLADTGWRHVLARHKQEVLERTIGKLNTPKPTQVDELFDSLVGLSRISGSWHWKGMSTRSAEKKLLRLVELRGSIAHRVSASRPVHKADVRDFLEFVQYLAATSHNAIRQHVLNQTGQRAILIGGEEWTSVSYNTVR